MRKFACNFQRKFSRPFHFIIIQHNIYGIIKRENFARWKMF